MVLVHKSIFYKKNLWSIFPVLTSNLSPAFISGQVAVGLWDINALSKNKGSTSLVCVGQQMEVYRDICRSGAISPAHTWASGSAELYVALVKFGWGGKWGVSPVRWRFSSFAWWMSRQLGICLHYICILQLSRVYNLMLCFPGLLQHALETVSVTALCLSGLMGSISWEKLGCGFTCVVQATSVAGQVWRWQE